jgi:gliding motility-associated protein GldC
MRKTNITFNIDLDNNNVPEKIQWNATDKPEDGFSETKAISVALWDQRQKNTLRIDLWSKDMPVNEMKRFYIDCIGGLAQSVLSATGDETMSREMNALCDTLVKHLEEEAKKE